MNYFRCVIGFFVEWHAKKWNKKDILDLDDTFWNKLKLENIYCESEIIKIKELSFFLKKKKELFCECNSCYIKTLCQWYNLNGFFIGI